MSLKLKYQTKAKFPLVQEASGFNWTKFEDCDPMIV